MKKVPLEKKPKAKTGKGKTVSTLEKALKKFLDNLHQTTIQEEGLKLQ